MVDLFAVMVMEWKKRSTNPSTYVPFKSTLNGTLRFRTLTPDDPLSLVYISMLIRRHQIRHRHDLRILSIRFRFLRIEWIDVTSRKHVRQNQVLENLYPLRGSGFIILFERFKEIGGGFVPCPCSVKRKDTQSVSHPWVVFPVKAVIMPYPLSAIHIFPPHSLMTPKILG